MWEWIGFFAVLPLFPLVVFLATQSGPFARYRKLAMWGALFKILGTVIVYEVIYRFYDGVADPVAYFAYGRQYASHVWRYDFGFILPEVGTWWGTHFIESAAAFVIAIVGPSERGAGLAFSLLSFIGMLLAARAFLRTIPARGRPFLLYALFFAPSLWFWTSSLSKEALITCALGLSFAGYIGDGRRSNWLLLLVAMLVVFAIRPHIAALVVIAVAGAPFLAPGRWSIGRIARGLALGVVAMGVFVIAIRTLGVERASIGEVKEFQQNAASNTVSGGSQIEQGGSGPVAIIHGIVNVLGRPFLWEARNPMALLAALELIAIWVFAGIRLRARSTPSSWRRHGPTRVAFVFALLYALLIGMTMFNLGLLARQRVLLFFPLLFAVEGMVVLGQGRIAESGRRRRGVIARPAVPLPS